MTIDYFSLLFINFCSFLLHFLCSFVHIFWANFVTFTYWNEDIFPLFEFNALLGCVWYKKQSKKSARNSKGKNILSHVWMVLLICRNMLFRGCIRTFFPNPILCSKRVTLKIKAKFSTVKRKIDSHYTGNGDQ